MSANLAVIDIGSNAIRLVIGSMNEGGEILRQAKRREPIRLGEDSFSDKKSISDENLRKTVTAFKNFQKDLEVFNVKKVRAVATSAVRDAKNKEWFLDRIKSETGIEIDVIDGHEEARLICKAVKKKCDLRNKRTLLMDIGGGSVEFSLCDGKKTVNTVSFPAGTVRLLNKLNGEKHSEKKFREAFAPYLKELKEKVLKDVEVDVFVGTGGNIERLTKLKNLFFISHDNFHVTKNELRFISEEIFSRDYEQRVEELGMRPDRADVILPATAICLSVIKALSVKTLQVPRVGLKDGALRDMADNFNS